jgi:hypothetical protein
MLVEIVPSSHALCLQELRFDVHPREVSGTDSSSLSRFELDTFLYMAEHVAVRGLDHSALPEPAHYLHTLPENALDEPFPGFCSPQGTPMRRVECTVQAHTAARTRLLHEIAALKALSTAPEAQLQCLERKLQHLGEAPSCVIQNDADSWTKMRECVLPQSSSLWNCSSLCVAWQWCGQVCQYL